MDNVSSVIFNDVVNDTQFYYHLVYPKNFNLVKTLKRVSQAGGQNISKKRRRRGRPRKEETRKLEEERRLPEETIYDNKTDGNIVQIPCSRTRYGRVTRPPKHMSKFVEIKDNRVSTAIDVNTITIDGSEPQQKFNSEQLLDVGRPAVGYSDVGQLGTVPKKMRKNVNRFTCGVCKKVYLGQKKMLKHHSAFPDHKAAFPDIQAKANVLMMNGTNSFLFDELIRAVGGAAQTERMSVFLTEISNFVNKISLLKSNLLQLDTNSLATEYYLDKNVSKVLELPEGLLQLNDRAFDDHFQENNSTFSTYIEERKSSVITPLQPLGYNLNLPQVNYDQISDNAVEAEALGKSNGGCDLSHESPILDINLDLFSFNGIK